MTEFGFTPFTEATANEFQKKVIQILRMFESEPMKGIEAAISVIVSIVENALEDEEDKERAYAAIMDVFESKDWATDVFSGAPIC